ncbi:hypothetical protein [Myxosarcina sp. GI1(2024)]
MPESAASKLDRYKQKIDELQRKAKEQERLLRERERKRRSTMLVAYGLLVMEQLKNGELSETVLKAKLDPILTQNSHRLAVGLPARKSSTERVSTAPAPTKEIVRTTTAKSPSLLARKCVLLPLPTAS